MKPHLILLSLLLAFPACAGVYKWTDAQGNIHYSDSPPPAAQSTQLKLQSYTGQVQVSRVIGADSGVTMYSAEWCGVPLITVGSEKMMGFDANQFMALWKSTQNKQ